MLDRCSLQLDIGNPEKSRPIDAGMGVLETRSISTDRLKEELGTHSPGENDELMTGFIIDLSCDEKC
jgi:hypothetical protein